MDVERWLPVVGFEGAYEVSDLGRVRSLDREISYLSKNGKPVSRRCPPRILRPAPVSGYPAVALRRDGVSSTRYVHDLVLRAFVGAPPPGNETRHLDGKRTNACLSNLRWGTQAENSDDQLRHGTRIQGERQGCARLTAPAVIEMRRRHAVGASQKELAAEYGVDKSTVWGIVREPDKHWKHVA